MKKLLSPKTHFLKSILTSNIKRLSFPFKLSYAVTYKCNLRCKMCNIWQKPVSKTELKLHEIDNFFQKANKFSWVGITGGDPFLRKDITEITDIVLNYCHQLSAIHFATNGQLTDRVLSVVENIRRKNSNLNIVFTVSIDGPPDSHNLIRGRDKTWETAMETFKKLKKTNHVKTQIGFTLSKNNLGKFSETFSSVRSVYPELRFDDINVNVFQKSTFYYENQDMEEMDPEALLAELRKIFGMGKERLSINNFLRQRYLSLYPRYIRTGKCPLKCQALSSTCFLDPEGNLFPCAIYNRKLLNIKGMKDDFEYLWNTDSAKQFSSDCANSRCPTCWSPCDAFSAIAGSLIQSMVLK